MVMDVRHCVCEMVCGFPHPPVFFRPQFIDYHLNACFVWRSCTSIVCASGFFAITCRSLTSFSIKKEMNRTIGSDLVCVVMESSRDGVMEGWKIMEKKYTRCNDTLTFVTFQEICFFSLVYDGGCEGKTFLGSVNWTISVILWKVNSIRVVRFLTHSHLPQIGKSSGLHFSVHTFYATFSSQPNHAHTHTYSKCVACETKP